jgi:hypothetical protein
MTVDHIANRQDIRGGSSMKEGVDPLVNDGFAGMRRNGA